MCGLAGAAGSDPKLTDIVRAMSDAQVHRGPDGAGAWLSTPDPSGRRVAFAHRRLAILDLDERSAQPMQDERGNVLVYNGEVYNYRELRAELAATGSRFRTESDSEVVLAAYACWGDACVERLAGMFAFALWDAEQRTVFLARDRLGIKPLYLAEVTLPQGVQTVLFASELRALLATGLLKRKLDGMGLATYVWHGFVTGPRTILAGVRMLPAGTRATLSLADLSIRQTRYWTPPAAGDVQDLDELRDTLETVARQHLLSDVPLGVFLSGGIDSSAVAALSVHADRGPVRTFNVAFDESEYDESVHARAVAEALGTEHTELRLTEREFALRLPRALDDLDQPTFDALNTWFVSHAAREAGMTVALAGTGGDELFGGYASFADLPRAVRAGRIAGFLPDALSRRAAGAVARAKTGPFGEVPPQTRWGKLGDALAVRGDLVLAYQVAYGLFAEDFQRALIDDERIPPIRLGLTRERAEELARLVAGEPQLAAIAQLELATFVGERLLRDTDVAAMSASLEVRVPLLDHRVVESVARLAEGRRFQPLGRKQALRDVGLKGLDPALFERPKAGFVLPIERWSRAGLRDEVGEVLNDADACDAVGLRREPVAALWRAFQAGAPGIYWSRVWSLYVLLRWARAHRLRV